MNKVTNDQTDELTRLQTENARLKVQMAELKAQKERKDDVRIPHERKRKMPTTNTDSNVQEEQNRQELSKWHWRAVYVFIGMGLLSLIIASLAGKYKFDFMYALFPLVPAIGAAIWGDQMKNILSTGKKPWIEFLKILFISVVSLVLLYISFLFIIAILLLIKPSKLFKFK